MLSPLKNIEAEDRPRYGKDLLDWEGKEAAYASAPKRVFSNGPQLAPMPCWVLTKPQWCPKCPRSPCP